MRIWNIIRKHFFIWCRERWLIGKLYIEFSFVCHETRQWCRFWLRKTTIISRLRVAAQHFFLLTFIRAQNLVLICHRNDKCIIKISTYGMKCVAYKQHYLAKGYTTNMIRNSLTVHLYWLTADSINITVLIDSSRKINASQIN